MTSEVKSGYHDRIGLWMIVAVMLLTTAVFFWTRSYYQHENTSLATHVDAQGQLHVLGITLGETTLKQAEFILQSKSDVALYLYPETHERAGRKLEAFFPAIADHTKVILLLDMGREALDQLEARATIPHLYPNSVARMNLAAKDRTALNQVIVRELTLIPNLTLSAENIKARFGTPDELKAMEGYDLYTYNHIGLKVRLNEDESPTLHFFNPTTIP
ncbi:MAG: hypothetical protein Q9M21_00455 [Mariprofundaceae bacterium]|nr:hypothetical protein [Mariprofundaceae bacterium]